MNKVLISLALGAGVALSTPVLAAETVKSEVKTNTKVEKQADGDYKEKRSVKEESQDAAGTTTKNETEVKVESDAEGNGEKTTTSTSVNDPKGLMNKTKTVVKDKAKYKDGKVETSHTKKVNGKTVEETSQESGQ